MSDISEKVKAAESALNNIASDLDRQKELSGIFRASSLGRAMACPKWGWLETFGTVEEDSVEKLRRFREGHQQEKLMRADVNVVDNEYIQRLEQPARRYWTLNPPLTGEIDDVLSVGGEPFIADYKSCSSAMFRSLRHTSRVSELLSSPFFWIRDYYYSLHGYYVLLGIPNLLVIFKDKESGAYKLIWDDVDENTVSFLLARLEKLESYDEAPEPIWCNACDDCPLVKQCFPGNRQMESLEKIDDPEIIADVERHEELKPMKSEYDKLHRKLNAILKGQGKVRVGKKWLYNPRCYNRTIYNVPKDIKEKYADKIEIEAMNFDNMMEPL
jgi:hypothetical protein